MSKSKVPYEEKVEIVRDYLEGRKGYTESLKRANNSVESFRRWVHLYKEKGAAGLLPNSRNKVYPEDVKRKAVQEYLSGYGSLESICEKYEIKSTRQLRKWLKVYNAHPLVFKTFDKAVQTDPDAHPLFHSDRGFQYTNRVFHHKLVQAGMTQSMSRVAHCIDNGPMEGFWGILKRERYYGRRFTSKRGLVQMIQQYIRYYNTRRVQRNLGVLTPMEKHAICLAA